MLNGHITLLAETAQEYAICMILFFVGYGMVACEKPTEMAVTAENPPTIYLSGQEYFDRLEVRGPLPERMDDEKEILIWRLVPESSPPRLQDLPSIKYGSVPAGLVQTEPKLSSPPSFVEGGIYSITVLTRGSDHPSKTIVIRNGRAEEFHVDDYRFDNSNVSYVPIDRHQLKASGALYFVPIMNYSPTIIHEIASYQRIKYGLQVQVKPNLAVEFSHTYNERTGQHEAEKLIEALKKHYPENSTQSAYVGFVPQDMRVNGKNKFAYAFQEGRYAVVSDARLAIFANDAVRDARLRKLVNRVIGRVYYDLPFSKDKRSVMFEGLRGPDDLDRMTEDF